jgi:hypothetical protein
MAQEKFSDEITNISNPPASLFTFDNGWWRLNTEGKKECRVSQCGFYSSLFILEYFGISYDPVLVCSSLPMDDKGVSLNDIRYVLESYGLITEGRKNVSIRDLTKIPSHTIAIFAIPIGQNINHYYCVNVTKNGPMFIDPPFSTTNIKSISKVTLKKMESALVEQEGVVLFVSKDYGTSKTNISDKISVTPLEHDLGEFLIDVDPATTEPFCPRFEIQNTSVTPIAVEIQTSCGCVGKTNWKSKIIDARSKAALEFEISPRSWVKGKKTEIISLKFPDTSEKFISITGTGHGGEGSSAMKLKNPSALVFDIGSEDARDFTRKLAKGVVLASSNTDVLSVKTNVSWVKAAVVAPADTPNSNKEKNYLVECNVTVTDEEISALCENNNALRGKVTITGEPSGHQIQFDVVLKRDPLVAVMPNTLFLTHDQKDSVTISVRENVRSVIKEVKVRSNSDDNSSILCDLQRIDNTSYQAIISFSPNPRSRYQLVRFDVKFEDGMKGSVTILASLKNDE